MSSFIRRTRNPDTGEFEDAMWLDNYFGRYNYGISFPSTGRVFRQSERRWEFDDERAPDTLRGGGENG